MATFHVVGKPNFTILVVDFGIVQVIKTILCAMFVFWWGSLHVFKDVSYAEYIILCFVYQVLNVNPRGMFWTINNDMYWIVGENVLKISQDTIIKSSTTTLVVNIVAQGVMMKEKPNAVSPNSKVSLFIDLCDSSNEDDLAIHVVVIPISMNLQVAEK